MVDLEFPTRSSPQDAKKEKKVIDRMTCWDRALSIMKRSPYRDDRWTDPEVREYEARLDRKRKAFEQNLREKKMLNKDSMPISWVFDSPYSDGYYDVLEYGKWMPRPEEVHFSRDMKYYYDNYPKQFYTWRNAILEGRKKGRYDVPMTEELLAVYNLPENQARRRGTYDLTTANFSPRNGENIMNSISDEDMRDNKSDPEFDEAYLRYNEEMNDE